MHLFQSVRLRVFARTNEGHYECAHSPHQQGKQTCEMKSGSELRPPECGLHCLIHHMKGAPLGFVGIHDFFFPLHCKSFPAGGPHVNHGLKSVAE